MKHTNSVHIKKLLPCLVLALTLFLLASCTSLPHYAQPRFQQGVPLSENITKIPYRVLTIEDFKAKSLPDDLVPYSHRLSAHTAVSIRPVGATRYVISRTQFYGKEVYLGAIEDLRFEAIMIPERSWWNPGLSKKRKSYVLQHEQIHFALMEIAAHRLNKQVQDTPYDFIVFEDTPAAAKNELRQKVDLLIISSRERALKEHTQFDEATSGQHEPELQQQWYDRVLDELQRSR